MPLVQSSLGTPQGNALNSRLANPFSIPRRQLMPFNQPSTTVAHSTLPMKPSNFMTPLPTQPKVQPKSQTTPAYQPVSNPPISVGSPISQPQPQTATVYTPTMGLYGQIVNRLANQGNSPYNQFANQSIEGLQAQQDTNSQLRNKAQFIADEAGNEIKNIGQQGARGEAGYLTTGTSPIAEGNAAIQAQTTAAQQKAVAEGANTQLSGIDRALAAQGLTQTGLTNTGNIALTGQGTAQGALGTAGGLVQPVAGAPFFGSPESGGLVGSGQGLMSNSINNAIQAVANGADINDPQIQSMLAPFGAVGRTAFNNALQQLSNGTYNPTAMSAIAQQNTSQSVNYQQASTELDTSLRNLDLTSGYATNFLTNEGLLNATDNPFWNKGINTFVGQFKNPADKLAWNQVVGDIKKFQSAILASNSGQIPTDVSAQIQSFDPSTLSPAQLLPYLDTLKRLGANQLSVLQTQSNLSLPSGNFGYKGQNVEPSTQPIYGPNEPTTGPTALGGSLINNPYLQGAIGGMMNFPGMFLGAVGGLFNSIFHSL